MFQEKRNPFQNLYRGEGIDGEQFVELFSPGFVLKSDANTLFEPGNVVLRGLQGSGKTMLLNLMKPEIRIAYHRKEGSKFPLQGELSQFVSAGINFRKSGIAQFSQVLNHDSGEEDWKELALFFGDFLNYWIVIDLFQNILKFYEYGAEDLLDSVGICGSRGCLDEIAAELSKHECWAGYFSSDVSDLETFLSEAKKKVGTYRRYIDTNIRELPEHFHATKSSIGQPIISAARLFLARNFFKPKTTILIRLDQYEELPVLDPSRDSRFGLMCQQVVHKALSLREEFLSFRIGSRHYAWPEKPQILNTSSCLELKRDYQIVDIDALLRKKEGESDWIFKDFAMDIFRRRVEFSGYRFRKSREKALVEVFDRSLFGKEKIELLTPNEDSRRRLIRTADGWSKEWIEKLQNLYADDAYRGKMTEAWAQQEADEKKDIMHLDSLDILLPWETKAHWMAERNDQAVLQIAQRNKQSLIYGGMSDILSISGCNILVFLWVCQHIWDALNKTVPYDFGEPKISSPSRTIGLGSNLIEVTHDQRTPVPTPTELSRKIQTYGILIASEEWSRKPNEGEQSSLRIAMIRLIGKRYYRKLTEDGKMSYPGHSGFSLKVEDIESSTKISSYIKLAVDYGDLYEYLHTSKNTGEQRKKYYLAPILCPRYKLPFARVKEPEYISAEMFIAWLYGKETENQYDSNQLEIPGLEL